MTEVSSLLRLSRLRPSGFPSLDHCALAGEEGLPPCQVLGRLGDLLTNSVLRSLGCSCPRGFFDRPLSGQVLLSSRPGLRCLASLPDSPVWLPALRFRLFFLIPHRTSSQCWLRVRYVPPRPGPVAVVTIAKTLRLLCRTAQGATSGFLDVAPGLEDFLLTRGEIKTSPAVEAPY